MAGQRNGFATETLIRVIRIPYVLLLVFTLHGTAAVSDQNSTRDQIDRPSNSTNFDAIDSTALVIHHIDAAGLFSESANRTTGKAVQDINLPFEMRNATADDPEIQPIGMTSVMITSIGFPSTIDCPLPEYPMIRILGGQFVNLTTESKQNVNTTADHWLNMTCEGGFHGRACPYTLRLAHQCSGASVNCTVFIEQPDEMARCPVAYYEVRYQCLPPLTPDNPLKPYTLLPPGSDGSGPCALLYVPSPSPSLTGSFNVPLFA
ncbi:uncharacterized protein LOC129592309 [Paramacrobiotus metropolitanus]|uniref:uncharacterized protein LOC129592309 n=1 Tax=Paramacrobiotus metropolitanus TaxID=2943436 RepID=UPI00244608E8|nr:uncharacterized protein LOC129592309 [Paramacrobiotus metropolitanus]